tara:strand:+ start:749 stop:1597 length:849 start_codon:yes stop_codon:yes gene_type:complete
VPLSIQLIAIDIDGTLLDSHGKLPSPNQLAVHNALKAGIQIVLATGRAFHHAQPIAKLLGPAITLIVNNGALTKRLDGSTLARRLIPREKALDLVTATRPLHQGVGVILDRRDEQQYLYEKIDWSHPQRNEYYKTNRAFITHCDPIEDGLTDFDPVQIAFNGSVDEMRRLADVITGLPEAQQLKITLTEYEHRDFSLLDIIHGGWSKGAALADWAEYLGAPSEAVMAIGDNLNDIEMLEYAGWPVVMENAVSALKTKEWPVTATNDNCGVAVTINKLLEDLT